MVMSFLIAVAWSSDGVRRRALPIFVAAVVAVGLGVSAAYVSYYQNTGENALSILPAGCVKPLGGFLIIASSLGYNDSISHGAPSKSWPVLDVTRGTDVTITVCNTYSQTVGFQVEHYLSQTTETVPPDRVITVNFLANQAGSFVIYCTTFSAIHVYLQGGAVNVI
jgi:hypothetical protein